MVFELLFRACLEFAVGASLEKQSCSKKTLTAGRSLNTSEEVCGVNDCK